MKNTGYLHIYQIHVSYQKVFIFCKLKVTNAEKNLEKVRFIWNSVE